jgi:hypothetical protein
MLAFRQEKMIKIMLKLFCPNGLLDNNMICVYTGEGSLTDEQQLFISKNETKMRELFGSLRRKTKPKNSYQLLCWVDSMLKEFFGGFVWLDISNRKLQRNNGGIKYYYDIRINYLYYIELLLNKNINLVVKKILNYIINNFNHSLCHFVELHEQKMIKNIIDNTTEVEYMFTETVQESPQL